MKLIFAISLLLIFTFIGCCGSKSLNDEVSIKERVVSVEVPKLIDTVDAEYKNMTEELQHKFDSLFFSMPDSASIEGSKTVGKNKIKVRFKPGERTDFNNKAFEIEVSHGSVDTIIKDTVRNKKIIETPEPKSTWVEKLGYMFLGFLIVAVIMFLIKRF